MNSESEGAQQMSKKDNIVDCRRNVVTYIDETWIICDQFLGNVILVLQKHFLWP